MTCNTKDNWPVSVVSVGRRARARLTAIGGIGDVLAMSARAQQLKADLPRVKVTMLCFTGCGDVIADLLRPNKAIDRLLIRGLPKERLARAAARAGGAGSEAFRAYRRCLREGLRRNPHFEIALTREDQAWARQWVRCHLDSGRSLLGVHLESGGVVAGKDLPADLAAAWLARLGKLLPGRVVALGCSRRFRELVPEGIAVLETDAPIRRSLAVLQKLSCLIAVDSSMKTASLAMGVPTCLIGDPKLWWNFVVPAYQKDRRNLFVDATALSGKADYDGVLARVLNWVQSEDVQKR